MFVQFQATMITYACRANSLVQNVYDRHLRIINRKRCPRRKGYIIGYVKLSVVITYGSVWSGAGYLQVLEFLY